MNKIESQIDRVNDLTSNMIELIESLRDPRVIQQVERTDENQKLMLFSDITVDLIELKNIVIKRRNKLIKKLETATVDAETIGSDANICSYLTKNAVNDNGKYISRTYEYKSTDDDKMLLFHYEVQFRFVKDKMKKVDTPLTRTCKDDVIIIDVATLPSYRTSEYISKHILSVIKTISRRAAMMVRHIFCDVEYNIAGKKVLTTAIPTGLPHVIHGEEKGIVYEIHALNEKDYHVTINLSKEDVLDGGITKIILNNNSTLLIVPELKGK